MTGGGPEIGLSALWRPDFAHLLNDIEATLHVLAQAIVFLAKPGTTPAERPVTLTTGLYKLYTALRKPQLVECEQAKAGQWGTAIRGASALRAAILR